MEKKVFFEKLADALELEDIVLDEDTDLLELDEYDSLSTLSIIALVDQEMGIKITGSQFLSITTVGSLMKIIGDENFK